jgi:homoserine kinase type II
MEGELKRVLAHYALGELRDARRAEQGFVNANWIVETTRGRYFLKRRHPRLRQPDLIRAQHQLIGRLQQAGFPAPTVVPTIRGDTVLLVDGELYDIQEYIEGEPYHHDRPSHLEEAALTLGRYHIYVGGFAPQALCRLGELYSPSIVSGTLSNLAEAWQLHRDPGLAEIARGLEAHAADLAARFAGHGALPHLVIHGDYYADNLLFDGDRIVGVVDYDKACWQPRLVELAEALIYFASPRPGHLKHLVYPGFLNWEPFFDFLRSYAQTFVLKEKEIGALPDYVRCIWLSVSLKRLLDKGPRPSEALEALQEVLALGDWAEANAQQMVEAAHSAMPR